MTKIPPQNRLIADDEPESEAPPALPPRPALKPSPTRNPRRREGKGSYPGRRQVTAYVDTAMFLGLKAISAQTEKPMIAIFEEALSAYVSSYMAQKKFQS